jgi:type IV pilus assembly protein PilE
MQEAVQARPFSRKCPYQASGFTLLELLIAVVLVAILTALALPAYTRHIQLSRRIDAKSALLDLAGRQETFFVGNNRFGSTASDLGYPSLPWSIVSSGGTSYYQLTVLTSADGQSYSALATPTGAQASDTDCFAYTINSTGAKGNQGVGGVALVNNTCW